MKALVQRVKEARVVVDQQTVGEIDSGLLIYLGVGKEDSEEVIEDLVEQIINLRIFGDREGKMNLSLVEVEGEVLVVSQFTLYGDCSQGRRPSFTRAADYGKAKKIYEEFIEELRSRIDFGVEGGRFGAYMEVYSINDGPVTFMLNS